MATPKKKHSDKISNSDVTLSTPVKKILQLSDPNKRVVAYIIDMLLSSIPITTLLLPVTIYLILLSPTSYIQNLALLPLSPWYPHNNFLGSAVAGMITVTVSYIYYVIIPSKIMAGQTFGKKLLDIRIVCEDSTGVGINEMTLRYSVNLLLGLLMLIPLIGFFFSFLSFIVFLINTILLYFDTKHQTLFDKIAGTVVVEWGNKEQRTENKDQTSN